MHSSHTDEGAASASAPEDPIATARRVIAEDERARVEACAAEIEQVLARHGMRLEVSPAHIVISPAG